MYVRVLGVIAVSLLSSHAPHSQRLKYTHPAAYNASVAAQSEWVQLHHFCYWELTHAHSCNAEWQDAGRYAGMLFEQSKWSKSVYVYLQVRPICRRERFVFWDTGHGINRFAVMNSLEIASHPALIIFHRSAGMLPLHVARARRQVHAGIARVLCGAEAHLDFVC